MKTIVLGGQLGKLFGRKHRLDVKTAAEAVRALVANFPALEKHLLENSAVGYRVKLHDAPLQDLKELHYPVAGTITITPVIAGAKSALGQILLGTVLIAAAFFTGGASLVGTGMFGFGFTVQTTFLGSLALGLGVSMVLGGIAQMLAPQPKTPENAERKANTYFDGPVNTTAQGNPVPVGYGEMIVGGAVISASITTDSSPNMSFGGGIKGMVEMAKVTG